MRTKAALKRASGQRQRQAPAGGRAVHRRYHGHSHRADGQQCARRAFLLVEHAQCPEFRQLPGVGQVVACAEGLARARDDHDPAAVLVIQARRQGLQLGEHRVGHGVVPVRAVQCDHDDARRLFFDVKRLVAVHRRSWI
jgi:hypothetical protein